MAKIRVHNIAFSSEKVNLSESGEKYAQIKHSLHPTKVLNKPVGRFWCDRTTGDRLFHWWKRYSGLWTILFVIIDGLKLNALMVALFLHKAF